MNIPTGPYRVMRPSARDAEPYLPWLIDKAVRVGRDNGYANIVDDGLALILADLGVRAPVGGFVDSDGRNATGNRPVLARFNADGFDDEGYNRRGFDAEGYNRDGVNENGEDRDDVIEAMVNSWDSDTAAAYAAALASRVS